MEKNDTKREILDAALELFSTQGYEATSVSQIADAVGIRKASLYSHFASKQEILETIIRGANEQYERRSLFAHAAWDDPAFTEKLPDITPDTAVQRALEHIRFILHDPQISRFRKTLTIEQFQNPELKALQTKRSYTHVMQYFTGLMRHLIRQGKLAGGDAEILAAQFCLPISAWIALCDREPEREDEILRLTERHIRQFFAAHRRSEVSQ